MPVGRVMDWIVEWSPSSMQTALMRFAGREGGRQSRSREIWSVAMNGGAPTD